MRTSDLESGWLKLNRVYWIADVKLETGDCLFMFGFSTIGSMHAPNVMMRSAGGLVGEW